MKYNLKYYLQICILLLSCNSGDDMKRQYDQLTSDTISLCLNQMMAVSYDGDDILQVKMNCMSNCTNKIVVFADTSLCTPCYIKQMPNWYDLIDSVKSDYGNSVEFCFVISVQKQNLDAILKTFEQVNFDYPCFLDTSCVFRRTNKNIPDNSLFHAFLLDESNNVVMVGNPQTNIKIRRLLLRYLKESEKLRGF